ncbi:PAS domain-containing protein [Deinococcus malanensis]|uniref:PAS domain-containing protein n=1 Tax=Deinococcus malanensis TaxID=1706855 RepID=UPI00362FDE97
MTGRLQPSAVDGASVWLFTAVNIDDLVQERQHRAQLQSMMDASTSCIKVLDLDSRLLSMNAGGMATMEIDNFDACRNVLWLDFWDGPTRGRVEAALERARRGERTVIEAARATFKGTPKWWEITMSPLYDKQGEVNQLSVVSRDITAAKAAQEAISALDAFVAFSKISSTTTDVLVLARHAVDVLEATLGDVTVAYSTLEDSFWKCQVWSDDLAPELVAVLTAGIPVTAPGYAQALATHEPVFVAGWDAEVQGAARTEDYGAAAFYPCVVDDRPMGLLTMGTRRDGELSERERAVFRSVGRSLTLALERAEIAQRMLDQRNELEARSRALEGFAELTHDLTLQTEPNALLSRSMELVLSLLPGGYAVFYQHHGGRWNAAALVGNVGSGQLQAAVEAGFPVGRTPTLDIPCETKTPGSRSAMTPIRTLSPNWHSTPIPLPHSR